MATTTAFKKQVCYAGGTLGGWLLGKALGVKELVPFTIIGGVMGFALAEGVVSTDAPVCKPKGVAGLPGKGRRSTKKR